MLKELQLANFKSFAAGADPIPFAPVTILVGANASGKSNVFDAIRFLQGIGMGLSIAEILTGKWEGGREVQPALRGGPEEVCWASEDSFTIRTSVEFPYEKIEQGTRLAAPKIVRGMLSAGHQITCRPKPQALVEHESLRGLLVDTGEQPVEIHPESFANRRPYMRSLLADVIADDMAFSESVGWADRLAARLLLGEYAATVSLDIQPWRMKGYVPLAVPQLGTHGENLSAVVRRICEDPHEKEQYLGWLAAFCAPEVTDIRFEQTPTDNVRVYLMEGTGQGKLISAPSLSDGTLRFMAILAAMLSAPEGSLFLIEEIETGLHPTRIHLLIELFEQFAESRNLQIIATTHSPQVLLSLSDQALRDAVLFARTPDSSGTVTRRLGDLPDFEEVTQQAHIDQLFTTGWMEQSV
ncbi:MAG: AAA family ATPase [Candidatus Nealsonbacteria bacterium]|nr:AAA family ATPase [Candidatus Nealsonbacteria bacterium]